MISPKSHILKFIPNHFRIIYKALHRLLMTCRHFFGTRMRSPLRGSPFWKCISQMAALTKQTWKRSAARHASSTVTLGRNPLPLLSCPKAAHSHTPSRFNFTVVIFLMVLPTMLKVELHLKLSHHFKEAE